MFTWLKTIVADFSHGEKIFSLVDSPESNSISTLIYAGIEEKHVDIETRDINLRGKY